MHAESLEFEEPKKRSEGIVIRFFMRPKQNAAKTLQEGRPIFEDVPWIEKIVLAGRETVERPVTKADMREYPKQWEQFQKGLEQSPDGTPLVEWPAISRSQVEELKHFHIATVEQLAEMSDEAISRMGAGWLTWKYKARDYIEIAKEQRPIIEFRNKMEQLQAERDAARQESERFASALRVAEQRLSDLERRLSVPVAEPVPEPSLVRPTCGSCGREFGRAMKPENHPELCPVCARGA